MKLRKRGTSYTPVELHNLVLKNVVVEHPIYDHNNKKYLNIRLTPAEAAAIQSAHQVVEQYLDRENKTVIDPLDRTVLKIKVPYNHGRVQVKMTELKTMGDYNTGDTVSEMTINFCGCWTIGTYSGISWKIISMT